MEAKLAIRHPFYLVKGGARSHVRGQRAGKINGSLGI